MKRKEPKYKYENALLIDDNELDNFINEKMLEASYFAKKIYVNTGAVAALEFLNNMVVMGEVHKELYPKVIFIDINMPMMDGFQFIENVMKKKEMQLYKPKLVILTSSVFLQDKQKSHAISEDIVFLNKPLTSEMLDNI